MKGEGGNIFQKLKLSQPYLVAITVGVLLGSIALVPMLNKKVIEDDIKYIEIDPNKQKDEIIEEIKHIISENPGKDIILAPSKEFKTIPPDERRRADEERNAQELAVRKTWEEEQRAKGIIVDEPPPPYLTTIDQTPTNKPARFIMCGINIVSLPSNVSPAIAPVDLEKILHDYLVELFSGITQKERKDGYNSMFSDPKMVNDVTFNNGAVVIDFNNRFIKQFGRAPSGTQTFWIFEQICRTLFQFTEVKSVTLTLNGNCEDMGDILQTGPGCYTVEREDWEFQVKENAKENDMMGLPSYYSLEGR
ncbi:unnamed protein product [marine sediment metagenome]|uniref:GerMN domain-containing protein n=1 Tax=marine sediment metagenome TaxID=412755 RepID=X1KQK5_9ZZZZ